jgi:hypothetical protein
MAAVWVASAYDLTSPEKGPCAVNARYRFPGAPQWEPIRRLDGSTGMGILPAYVRVGPGGLAVVVWTEANPADSSLRKVRSVAFDPGAGGWEPTVTDVTPNWFVPTPYDWLAPPVMGEGGTFVVAWSAKMDPMSNQVAQYSATRSAIGVWSGPVQISTPTTDRLGDARLALRGGTTVAAWESINAANQETIYANARDAGQTWGSQAWLASGYLNSATLRDVSLWPDGTAMVLWDEDDSNLPSGADSAMYWNARPPSGPWGGGGQGQIGGKVQTIFGGALSLADDGSGVALWGLRDTNQPANQEGRLEVASWPPGGPDWSQPEALLDGQVFMAILPEGLDAGPEGTPVAAAWLVVRSVTNPLDPSYAFYFSELGGGDGGFRLYLPLVTRN